MGARTPRRRAGRGGAGGRRAGSLSVRLLLHGLLGAAAGARALAAISHGGMAEKRKSCWLADEAPSFCHHNATLFVDPSTPPYDQPADMKNPNSCSSCVCPDGWRGADCSLCGHPDVCPARRNGQGRPLKAVACSRDRFRPTDAEARDGKRLICSCGIDSFPFGCSQQPGTNLIMELKGDLGSDEGGALTVLEVAATPAMGSLATDFRLKYAFPQVWTANYTNCKWSRDKDRQACAAPLDPDKNCNWVHCEGAAVECPPKDVPTCKDYGHPGGEENPGSPCGFVNCPGGTEQCPPAGVTDYWVHKCYAAATPPAGSTLDLRCEVEMAGDAYRCLFSHDGMHVPPFIGLTCQVGNCLYSEAPPEEDGGGAHHWKHDTWLVYSGLAAFSLLYLGAFLFQVHLDVNLFKRAGRGDKHTLPYGDKVALTRRVAAAPHVFAWSDLECRLPQRDSSIIAGIHGKLRNTASGAMCALMGPSGAGKTTLLDALAGRSRRVHVSGEVRLDGEALPPHARRSVSGYVAQQDILPGTSTVLEHLLFHAHLRMPRECPAQEKHDRAREIVDMLGLRKVAHSFIGDDFTRGISGGEKRRVSIATELVVHPQIMFLDEPTTGLDSSNAAKVVDILKGVAAEGVMVVLSIHQPRSDMLRAMSGIVLLSLDGGLVFSGPLGKLEGHCRAAGHGPPPGVHVVDHMLDVIIRMDAGASARLVGAFEYASEGEGEGEGGAPGSAADAAVVRRKGSFEAGLPRQVFLLFGRLLKRTVRNPLVFFLTFVASLTVAVAVGYIFENSGRDTEGIQNRFGCLFFMLWYLSLITVASLPVWHDDALVAARERASKAYSSLAYFFAVMLHELVLLRIVPPVFFLAAYGKIRLNDAPGSRWRFVLVLILANVGSTAMTLLLGLCASKVTTANVLGVLVMLLNCLFGGYMLSNKDLPALVDLVGNLFPNKHAYEMLVLNEFEGVDGFAFTATVHREVQR